MLLAIIVGAFLLCWLIMGVFTSWADNELYPKRAGFIIATGLGGCAIVVLVAAMLIFS